MKRCALYFLLGCLPVALAPSTASAQTGAAGVPAQNADDLRTELEQLRAQMAAQMRQIGALQARLDEMQRQKPAAAASVVNPVADQMATPPAAAPTPQVSGATTGYQTFSEDQEAASRVDNAPLNPELPGFFRLPGTQTFLKIGGYFKTDFIYDGKPAGNPELFIPSSFPAASLACEQCHAVDPPHRGSA